MPRPTAAQAASRPLVLLIDEVQYLKESDLAALLMAVHKVTQQVRLDRLTPREKEYLRAMAALGPGPHRSGDVAREFGTATTNAAPLRHSLIQKGMIYSPQHGDTAFTVPMFDGFMRRTLPEWTSPKSPRAKGRRR